MGRTSAATERPLCRRQGVHLLPLLAPSGGDPKDDSLIRNVKPPAIVGRRLQRHPSEPSDVTDPEHDVMARHSRESGSCSGV